MNLLHPAWRVSRVFTLVLASLGSAHAAFPGENGVIVYGKGFSLWKVSADGVTSQIGFPQVAYNPAVAPNGKRVAAIVPEGDQQGLWVMNLDGGQAVRVGQIDDFELRSAPAWSPDGKSLALMGRGSVLYIFDVATGSRRTLTVNGDLNWSPTSQRLRWSPLGQQIVAGRYPERDSWVIDVASGQATKLTNLEAADWFAGFDASLVGISNMSDGSLGCVVRVYPGATGRTVFPVCGVDNPLVSANGQALLTSTYVTGENYSLTVQDFQGQNVRNIASGLTEARVDWSRVPMTTMRTTLLANNQWSVPEALGGDSDTYTSQSALAVMPDNGAQGGALRRALGIGPDGRVYERAQASNGNWGAWVLVPGPAKAAAGMLAKHVAIAGALDGSLQAVIVAVDDVVYHAMRYPNGSWSGFAPVNGANGAANFAARDVAIAIVNSSSSAPGQAHVVANGLAGGTVYHRVRLDDGNWTPWRSPGGPATNAVALAFAGNKDLYLVVTNTAGGLSRTVRHASGAWDSWVNVAPVPVEPLKDVSLSIASDGSSGEAIRAHLAYVTSDNQVSYQARANPGAASSWTRYPLQWLPVMTNGRSVSITLSGSTPELLAVQAQPQ